MPGVQKPHCRPCSCMKPSWIGWSLPSCSSPSTVITSRPSACTASTVQDFTGTPSSSTVQAPQCVVSQPMWVPVSRSLAQEVDEQQPRLHLRLARGAVDRDAGSCASPWLLPSRALGGLAQGPDREHPGHLLLVLDGAAAVGAGAGGGRGEARLPRRSGRRPASCRSGTSRPSVGLDRRRARRW